MKKVGLIALLAGILLEILPFSEAFSAGTFTAFGPKDYIRTTGKPTTAMEDFSVLDPNTSYTLHIYNGGKNNQFKGKVSSAVISLDGAEVVRPNEFNQNVSHIENPIKLSKDNALAVELRSKPDSGLTIEIIGVDNDPPTIVATLDPSPNAAGWNKTDVIVSFACSDTTSGIAFCPAPVLVQQEGADQVITGTATDIAGNMASASVKVNLDKTPPVLTIISPLPGKNLEDPSVTVQGTINEALSGVAAVTCNGIPATFSNSSFTCNVSLVEGQNTVEIQATDLAGNVGYSSISVAFLPPALELAFVYDMRLDWWDKGSGGSFDGNFARPITHEGFYGLGSFGQTDYGSTNGFIYIAKELEPGGLAIPVDYTWVYSDWGSGATLDGSFWKPVPPAGYVCLGLVAQRGYSKPSTDAVRCVREDLTVPAKVGNTIWIDHGTGASYYFGSWQIIPADENGIFLGTFTGSGSSNASAWSPPTDPLFTIDARRVKRYNLSGGEIEELIQRYGPDLYFSSSYNYNYYWQEHYFLDDPEYVLDNGTTLVWGLVQNEWDYGSFSFSTLGSLNISAAGLMQDVESFVKSSPYFGDSRFRYYLHIYDSLKPGSLDRAKALVRVRPWNWLSTELQFWFFYPFNGPGRAEVCMTGNDCVENHWSQIGRHYGDWEQVTVRVDNRSKQLISVYMSRHGGGQSFFRTRFPEFNGTNPRIYVAKYSHAHYPTAGVHDYERVYETEWFGATQSVDLRDLTNGSGAVFSASLPGKYRIISSAVPGSGVTEPDWLQFQGRWGQYERLQEDIYYIFPLYTWYEVGAGPTGPAMKRSWVYGDSGENWWWTRRLEGTEACFDGIDNDGDGEIDCHDPDCWLADPVCILKGWRFCKDPENYFDDYWRFDIHSCPF
jgi:hypothetical protein